MNFVIENQPISGENAPLDKKSLTYIIIEKLISIF